MSERPLTVPGPRRQLPVYSPLSAGAIVSAATSGRGGDAREELRALLARRFAARAVSLYASGTQALTAAIATALARSGTERVVALPAYTCYDVATAAVGADARVLLYDIDPDTLAPDWSSFEDALRHGAAAAVLAPLYGLPFDWRPAAELAGRHGTFLIEDAAQAAGASWGGQPVGTFGHATTLSFGRGKGWTGGGGGAVLWRHDGAPAPAPTPDPDPEPDPEPAPPRGAPAADPATAAAAIRVAAAAVAQLVLGRPAFYGVPRALPWLHLGETRYHPPAPLREMTPFSARLVLRTDDRARAEARARSAAGARWARDLARAPGVRRPTVPPAAAPGYLRFPARVTGQDARRHLLHRGARHGIELAYPTPLDGLPEIRARMADPRGPGRLPGAESLVRELVTLPTHSRVTPGDRASIRAILTDARRP